MPLRDTVASPAAISSMVRPSSLPGADCRQGVQHIMPAWHRQVKIMALPLENRSEAEASALRPEISGHQVGILIHAVKMTFPRQRLASRLIKGLSTFKRGKTLRRNVIQ